MTTLEEQIQQMRALAERHYPDDSAARNEYLVGLLLSRLREYHAQFISVPVKEMK
jgi:hypothetical protein